MCLGLAFTFNGFNSVSFFLGSVIALIVSRLWPEWHRKYTVAASSGIIAGEGRQLGKARALLLSLAYVLGMAVAYAAAGIAAGVFLEVV